MVDSMPIRAKLFIFVTAGIGVAVLGTSLLHWQSADLVRFICYLVLASVAATMKVRLPGIESTMSVHFLFLLLGVVELSLPETMALGCTSAIVQSLWRPANRPQPVKVIFNVLSMSSNTIAISYLVYHKLAGPLGHSMPLMLVTAACAYFLCNTLPISIVVAITEHKSLRSIWTQCYFWSFPYYLVGAALVVFITFLNRYIGWQSSLMVLPVVYWIFRSYRLYLERLEEETRRVEVEKQHVEAEKRHVEEVSELHVRTIEALALAIDAKDHTTHKHLHRVRTYAMEIARELGLTQSEIDALRAAALLHDIGKLAVPDHIINKPGRLTPEEFDKMKIHPVVGAEILEKVAFPYPVAPIVRSHHEKWNGSGYPNGLAGEEIPIGARILAAVDCLDALASDRQYRKALPLNEAMDKVVADAGKSFDPKVVAILKRSYVELEKLANAEPLQAPPKLSTDIKVERGLAPAAGFAESAEPAAAASQAGRDAAGLIAAARRQGQEIVELSRQSMVSLSVKDIFSLLAVRMKTLVPHDAMAVYCPNDDVLAAEFVSGDNFRLFSSLQIPLGEGLSGWVAQNHKAILNGNPSVEPGYLNDPKKYSTLRSALAVPIEGAGGVVAVLALYRAGQDAFTADDLRVVEAIGEGIGTAIDGQKPKATGIGAGSR